jgi:hypothetical protein
MSIETSIAPINITNNTSIAPIKTTAPIVTIVPIQSMPLSKVSMDLGKLDNIPRPIIKTVNEEKESKQAIELLPISTLKIDEMKAVISEIDIRDPNSLQIITPTNVINYLDDVYGDVDIEILEPDALSISTPSVIDISTLPIDIGKNTSLDFIAFDPGMAFLASNGTFPENIVIAENMASEETGLPVLLSLNKNSEQNLQVIQSLDIQPIQLMVDIPLGLDAVEFSDFIVDISNRTETIQIISPDLVIETSYDPQIQMTEFAILSNNIDQPPSSSNSVSNFKNFFGDVSGVEIRKILDNPQINPNFVPLTTVNDDGRFFINIHGEIASSELEEYDCRDFERVGFVGRQGLILITTPGNIARFALDIKPKTQRVVGDVCKLPKLIFKPEMENIHHNVFGLSHIDSKGNMKVVLSNYDLVKIFGNRDVSLHSVLNLVRLISGGSRNINIDISACLVVSENFRSKGLDHFRIGDSERDIPYVFGYFPTKIEPIDAPRLHGKGKDSSCKFGLKKSTSLQKECDDFQSKQVISQEMIDPNVKLSGQGISTALNTLMIANVNVFFNVSYSFKKDPLLFYLPGNIITLKGTHFTILHHWYDEHLIEDDLFDSDEFIELGLNRSISISDILPEIIEVFNSFKKLSTIEFDEFKTRLIPKLKSNKLEINARIK